MFNCKRKRPRNDTFFFESFERHFKPIHSVERHLSFWEVEQGPDKYSFPSGHASRSTFILLIFSFKAFVEGLCGMWTLVAVTIWWFSICTSRVCLGRHFFLDILCGIVAGVVSFLISNVLCDWVVFETIYSVLGLQHLIPEIKIKQ